jgi:outer membrane protein assembly factor BamB
VAAVAVVVVAVVAWFAVLPDGGTSAHGTASRPARAAAAPPAGAVPPVLDAAESGLLPWHLAAPLSREVVVPGTPGQLIVLGGLTSAGTSASGVYALRTATGAARRVGVLSAGLHDAAGVAAGGRTLVFGGGSPVTVGTVQEFSGAGTARMTGSLPAPRSDAAAVTVGGTSYVVGGYDGRRPDASVLATTDGRTFTTVAALPVPVRYPAVAALNGVIYVFGGQAITGPDAGTAVAVIQAVNPARHTAAVIGRLPEPLAGAAAVTVDGEVFVAGGDSPAAGRPVRGLGTTQLSGAPGSTVSAIWAFNPATRRLLTAGRLQVPVSHAAVAATGSTAWIVGGESGGTPVSAVQMLRPDRAFGTAGAPGAGSPYFGAKLLIADRGNNRLLLMDAAMHVVWRYPAPGLPRDPLRFYFPDDAFFTDHGTAIISNQEQNETIIKLAYPSGKIIWSFGHPGHSGTAAGYLNEPDDAYLLKNGQVTVADAQNCRVLVINANRTIAHQIGTNGVCVHRPPASMGSPNGDTPLADGNLLVSEINGSWVSEYTPSGKLAWTVQLPISYPSDPQQLGPDRYLIADYALPGQILEFNRAGKILYRYRVASGPGRLNHPSLAELLPSGVFMTNDDYSDRMIAIDPSTGALVWQYGITGKPGTAAGELNTPDGFDLLLPDGSTPTHTVTG